MSQLQFVSVDFTYPNLAEPLISNLSFVAPVGWTGVVGPNGVGKTTVLSLATGILQADSGSIVGPGSFVRCAQRTDEAPADLSDLLSYPDASAGRLASLLGLNGDWPYRWDSLSHGERKRAQIATALWKSPEMLVIDEPTNHVDRQARLQLAAALETYGGIGLIVSHDRDLLDRICSQCLFLRGVDDAVMRPGGVSDGLREEERERVEQTRVYEKLRESHRRLEREAQRRLHEASTQDRKRSKRGLRWKDSDARQKIDTAIVSGADGKAGRLYKQLDGRRQQSAQVLENARRPVEHRLGISVQGTRSRRDTIIYQEAGFILLPDGREIHYPDLVVRPEDRIVLQGPNGAGKTTLIESLLGSNPHADSSILCIPQEVSAASASDLMDAVRKLDHEPLGRVISTVSRLGSDPQKILETSLPSPGETRKLMLALGLEQEPSLVVMDEPTNHLDLRSIECLEAALAEYPGALLFVSHDDVFVRALARKSWTFERDKIRVLDLPDASREGP